MLPQKDFKETVMRRVRMVFVVRSLIVPTVLELSAVLALIGSGVFFISIKDVFLNLRRSINGGSVFEYMYEAVLHTEVFVQFVMAVGIFVSGYFVYRIVRTFRISSVRDTVSA